MLAAIAIQLDAPYGDPLYRLSLTLQNEFARRLPVLEYRAHPSQLNFRVATNGEYKLDVAFICWHPGTAL